MGFSYDKGSLVNQLVTSINLPSLEEKKLFEDRLEELLRKIASTINTKEGGVYLPEELLTFQQYFTSGDPQTLRNVYRFVVDFGALPNTGSTSVAHGLTFDSNTRLTRAYGGSTDPTAVQFLPLPFSSPTLANNVSLEVDGTNVTITTGSNRSSFTATTVVLEYTKAG